MKKLLTTSILCLGLSHMSAHAMDGQTSPQMPAPAEEKVEATVAEREQACFETQTELLETYASMLHAQKMSETAQPSLISFGYTSSYIDHRKSTLLYSERIKYLESVVGILNCAEFAPEQIPVPETAEPEETASLEFIIK